MMHPHLFPLMFLGPVGLVVLAIVLAIVLVPIAEILHKAGYSRIWVLVWFVPFVNLIFLWIFAFSDWPSRAKGN
jgi:predicted PurR-regulated permease PerM